MILVQGFTFMHSCPYVRAYIHTHIHTYIHAYRNVGITTVTFLANANKSLVMSTPSHSGLFKLICFLINSSCVTLAYILHVNFDVVMPVVVCARSRRVCVVTVS